MMEWCVNSVSLSAEVEASAAVAAERSDADEEEEDSVETSEGTGLHAVTVDAELAPPSPLAERSVWVSAASHAVDTLVDTLVAATPMPMPTPPLPNRPAARGNAAIGAKCAKRSRTDEKPSGCALKSTCQMRRTARMAPMPCVHTFIDSLCRRKMEATQARIV